MSEHDPQERVAYKGDIKPVFDRVANDFELGAIHSFSPATVGYEDFNVLLETEKGKHFVKVFSEYRTPADIDRLEEIMQAVLSKGVRHPKIYEFDSRLQYRDQTSGLTMMVMEHIPGQTFYDTQRVPNDEELAQIMKQATLINSVDLQPAYLEDSWSILNTAKVYEAIKDDVTLKDKEIIETAIGEFSEVDTAALPHRFVHGDLTRANLIKAENGQMYVIDFSVANWYPRIQELAVVIGNLMNNVDVTENYLETMKRVVSMYVQAGGELTEAEMTALPAYARMAFTAELVGALKERLTNPNVPPENDHWMELGRAGLKRSLSQ